jgi:hypothetical protein
MRFRPMATMPHLGAITALLCAALALARPAAARAQAEDPQIAAQVKQLNAKALEDLDSLDFEAARQTLKTALKLCDQHDLEQSPSAARAHLRLGIVLLIGFKQRDEALEQFQQALAIRPHIRLPEKMANPEVVALFGEAVARFAPPAPKGEDHGGGAGQGESPEAPEEAGAAGEAEGDESNYEEGDWPHWFLGLALGGGAGFTSGHGEVTPQGMVSPSRIAPAALGQASPEIGYFVREDLLISVQMRFQYVTGTTQQNAPAGSGDCGPDHVCTPARSAVAGFARATWLWGEENLHPYLTATAGGGYIRHVATLKNVVTCGDPAKPVPCVDTVAAGPVFVGGGAGLFYSLYDHLALTLGLNALLGFTTFTAHVDLNGGIALEF